MRLSFEVSLVILLCSLISCTTIIRTPQKAKNAYPQTAVEIGNLSSQIDKAYYSFLGTFFNKNEVENSSSFLKGEILRSVPIWNEKKEKHWFAMAWYALATPEEPLAIGVFHIETYATDTFKLNYYALPPSVTVSEIWTAKHFLSEYTPQDLLLQEGCSDVLIYEGNNSFKVMNDSVPCDASMANHLKYFDLNLSLNPEEQVHANCIPSKDNVTCISEEQVSYGRTLQLGQ
ncbi:MAG: Unknown protein [uncultured Aureispira sp.]|uniref:Lipoprotein n=1 Tax=uncultured Aureispira sp. TaxID=1331704 RepID=A0A6S6SBL9_9BACT|nr:MAG: Unknown protein [uncultured Aureispira sp.]